MPSKVRGNVNEAEGSDNDGQTVTSGVTLSTKGGTTVGNGHSF